MSNTDEKHFIEVQDESPPRLGNVEHYHSVQVLEEKTLHVANVNFATALGANKPNPWGKGHIRLYAYCLLIYLVSTMNGYDGSLMSSINALPNYQSYYSLPANGASTTGIVFAIFNVGQMTGSLFVWLADYRGRRFPIFIGCFGVLIGTIVTSTAPSLSAFIAGRFLLSFFATLATTTAPMYMVEIAPPAYRATVSGLYNTLYYLGSIIATTAVLGAHMHLSDRGNLDWRLPLWLQMLCPGLVCLFVWLVPESPRYLIARQTMEEAREFFIRYHANGDKDHPIVKLEMEEIENSLKETPMTTFKNFFDLRALIKSRARRYRTALNLSFSWFGQFSGNNVISYYLPLLLIAVNITDTNTQLLLNVIYALVGWIFATLGAPSHDRFGRRPMLLSCTLGMALCLAITAGTAADYERSASMPSSRASIAFIYVFGAFFAYAYTPLQPIYPAEVMSTDMRAKGMWLFQMTAGLAGFVNNFAAPVALDRIRYWFYVFFVLWDLLEVAVIYWFYVETKGRTLEELDEVFESKNPRKESTRTIKVKEKKIKGGEAGEEAEVVLQKEV